MILVLVEAEKNIKTAVEECNQKLGGLNEKVILGLLISMFLFLVALWKKEAL